MTTFRLSTFRDDTKIMGHDNVKDYFEREQQMLDEHGMSIVFQLYRLNLRATTLQELQGEKLAEVKVDSGFVSGTETVTAVKRKIRALFEGTSRTGNEPGGPPVEADRVTFFFGGRPMEDDRLFYADHFVMLPAWVQVCLHRCEREELTELISKLSAAGRGGRE